MGIAQERYRLKYEETMSNHHEMILRSEDIRRQEQHNENLCKAMAGRQQTAPVSWDGSFLQSIWQLITSAPKTSLYIFGGWAVVGGVMGFQPIIFAIGCGSLWWAHNKM